MTGEDKAAFAASAASGVMSIFSSDPLAGNRTSDAMIADMGQPSLNRDFILQQARIQAIRAVRAALFYQRVKDCGW